ncbi:MAG TPA: hypothetical protein VGF61_21040 [Candidatus Acidoferrum sp.]
MHKVFFRCNGGDYYSERNCPFDGWSRPELQRLLDVVAEMKKNVEPISISALREKGFESDVLDRVIVIEFGAEPAVFDAFHPEGYIIAGQYVPRSKLGPQHT